MKHQNQKHNEQTKHQKRIEAKHPQKEKLASGEVIETLKKEILDECRQVAKGIKVSIYELIEMTKELIALEEKDQAAPVSPEEF